MNKNSGFFQDIPDALREFASGLVCPPLLHLLNSTDDEKVKEHRSRCNLCHGDEETEAALFSLKEALESHGDQGAEDSVLPGQLRSVSPGRGGWWEDGYRNPPEVLVLETTGDYITCIPCHPFPDAAIPGDFISEDSLGLPLVFVPCGKMALKPSDLGPSWGKAEGSVLSDLKKMIKNPIFYPEQGMRILSVKEDDPRTELHGLFLKTAMACSRVPLFQIFSGSAEFCDTLRKKTGFRVEAKDNINLAFFMASPPEDSLPLVAASEETIAIRVAYLKRGALDRIDTLNVSLMSDYVDDRGWRNISGAFPEMIRGICGSMVMIQAKDGQIYDGEWLETDGWFFQAAFRAEVRSGSPLLALVVNGS
ncbi:hypothetical protein LZ24_01026 [Desulfobotulus alkaliphilus]|uniref:Uncharacterized protein n=1 Tax=Desulfobotulus alkaliphilus TaxID=622671 RepID=A0A562S165_9BACT|nr:hypothetical protein [Desulfobotulus alkaliphilus]TWI74420.1 hypothetical protein LZ24_01026 [Desulfobotulus alkaliphilus]